MSKIEMLEELNHREQMLMDSVARAVLSKLTVADLRVLHRHYFKNSDGDDLNKSCLLDEIVPEYVADQY